MYRPAIIAGTRAQFLDWCHVHRTNPVAATYVASEDELRAALSRGGDVKLWGDYTLNPAFLAYSRLKRAA